MTDLQFFVNGKEIGHDSDINKNILYGLVSKILNHEPVYVILDHPSYKYDI
jgi:hypothetical protein